MPINEGILTLPGFNRSKQVRLIGPGGEQLGTYTISLAQNLAYDKGLDLVLIAPQNNPPVCKILDYGKFKFERDKKEKEARKNQQVSELKEIQLTVNIDTNDFNTKARNANRFLENGDRVRVVLRFRGRQLSRTEQGTELLKRFEEACSEKGQVDKPPVLDGRSMTMFIAPIQAVKQKQAPKPVEQAAEENTAEKVPDKED